MAIFSSYIKKESTINTLETLKTLSDKSPGIDKKKLSQFTKPDWRKAAWQIINSFVPFLAVLVLMYHSLNISYWLTLVLALPAAGLLVRIFIIFHDCGHGSFFKSRRANNIVGFFAGILTFVPYSHWTHKHAIHHSSAGDLERRGTGDVWTLTVEEYKKLSRWRRLEYRLYRHPLVMFIIGPVYLFLINNRFVVGKVSRKERLYVYGTNLGILAIAVSAILLIGLKAYLMIQLPIILFAGVGGIWLFYVQHQYEDVYWAPHDAWSFESAALEGSSFYKLPKILQWFSGNIGFHHIHHLSPRIPNYYLEACHKAIPEFRNIKPITFWSSFQTLKYRLFDEELGRLVSFAEAK